MPLGKTRDRMISIGKLSGLNHELEALELRAHNKFLLDHEWYLEEFWPDYTKKLRKAIDEPVIDHDWLNWCWVVVWNTYAIPNYLVGDAVPFPYEDRILPFMRMDKVENKYSLPSQVEAFINYSELPDGLHSIPFSEMSLEGYTLWESPIYRDMDHFKPIVDMELISKIADFSDPRRCFLDYWKRNESIPTELLTKNHRAQSALQLLVSLYPYLKERGYEGATWYTRVPVAYTGWMLKALDQQLPDLHASILLDLESGREVEDKPKFVATLEFLDQDRRNNKSFWKKKTKSRIKSVKKENPSVQPELIDNLIDHSDCFAAINMDDARDIFLRAIGVNNPTLRIDRETEEEIPWDPHIGIANLERPDWLDNDYTQEEYVYNPDIDQDQYELELLKQLDSIDWDPADCLEED
jgi:hypothetical protein